MKTHNARITRLLAKRAIALQRVDAHFRRESHGHIRRIAVKLPILLPFVNFRHASATHVTRALITRTVDQHYVDLSGAMQERVRELQFSEATSALRYLAPAARQLGIELKVPLRYSHGGAGAAAAGGSVVVPPSSGDIKMFGSSLNNWYEDASSKTASRMSNSILDGIKRGDTEAQIRDALKRDFGAARQASDNVTRTIVSQASADARRDVYEANADMIAGIQQISVIDDSTSDICFEYNEETWSIPDYEPMGPKELEYDEGVPRHFRCRSIEVPLMKTLDELLADGVIDMADVTSEMVDAFGGDTPPSIQFDSPKEFFDSLSSDEQDAIIGEELGSMYRDGDAPFEALKDLQGNELDIEGIDAALAEFE